jgi:ATP adenylyltransferase
MDTIWAPWRMQYIGRARDGEEPCVLCEKPKQADDRVNLVLLRGRSNYVMLNLYPYNPGHLMVAPYRHLSHLTELTADEMKEHYHLVSKCTEWLARLMKPDGFNIGMNLGRTAGAGIEGHIHSHIVPRWNGDTNFMPVVGETKVVSEALSATYDKLKKIIKKRG